MNHKEIEQAVKGCFVSSKKRLLADKDFLHFLHYFPAGVSDEVKRYFNQAVTGKENFFMVPDREDKQKAICSRCGKNIILPSDLRHKDRAVCPSCAAQGEVVHGWRRQFTNVQYYFTYYERALYDKEAIIARSFAVYRCVDAKAGTIAENIVPHEYYLMRKSGVEHWSHESDYFERDWWGKRRTLYNKDSVMRNSGYVVQNGQERLALLLADSWLKYSQLDAYIRLTNGGGDALGYIDFYHKHPQLEYLMKMGLWNIIDEGLREQSFSNLFNWRGQTPQKLLGVQVNKNDILALSVLATDINTLKLSLYLKKNTRLSLAELACKRKELERLSNYDTCAHFECLKKAGISVESALNYIKKQNQETSRGLHYVLIDWSDYVRDCQKLELDMTDTAVAKPRDLQRAHQNVVAQLKIKADELLNKQIAKLRKKRERYNFSDGGLMAKVAASAEELIAEGDALHHCVGTYADRHAKGECTIILIRKQSEPDKPYYTMELSPRGVIVQVRGDHNCGMTKDVEAFIKAYKEYLRKLTKKRGAKAA